MRHTKHIPFLLATLLMASVTFAQTTGGQDPQIVSAEKAISEARNQYIETNDISPVDNKTLAQVPGRGTAMPLPGARGYPRGTYATPWSDHGDAGHVLVGAAIGFGLGALVGVKANQDPHPEATGAAVLIFGGLGALLGGLIAGSHTRLPSHRGYQPFWPGDPEESDLRARSRSTPRRQVERPTTSPVLTGASVGEGTRHPSESAALTP